MSADDFRGLSGNGVQYHSRGGADPAAEFTGRCIAFIERLDEDDHKLIVVPDGVRYTDEQIAALTEFQERFHTSRVVRARSSASPVSPGC